MRRSPSKIEGAIVITAIVAGYLALTLLCLPVTALGWLLGYDTPLHRKP